MQDPRIRLVAVTALSVASYASVWGALATMIWWAVFSPRGIFRSRALPVVTALAMITVVSIVVALTGGDGASYFIRFTAILLVALYAYASFVPGEILGLSVWLFGRKGFEPGLTAEFCLQSLRVLGEDLSRSFMAIALKENGSVWKWLVPVTGLLVKRSLVRASEQADLLAIRGYRKGGSMCPAFHPARRDFLAGSLTIFIGLFAFIPVRDIFIALH
ncbi:MAG: hypothetical protein LUO88_04770 [Methanoregulaceae archaeon]|nr:hypothetical protein [Methanoregulaceae archaeon]